MKKITLLASATVLCQCAPHTEPPEPAPLRGIAHAQQCMNKIGDDAVHQARPSAKDHYLEEFRFTRLEFEKASPVLMAPHH